MTVIVGITDGERAVLGADRLYTNGEEQFVGGKLHRLGHWTFAISGESWAPYIIKFDEDCVRVASQLDVPVHVMALEMRKALARADYLPLDEKGEPQQFRAWGLMARGGDLYWFSTDFFPHKADVGALIGTGSGCRYALGAGHRFDGPDLERVRLAIEVACELTPSCGGGIDILQCEGGLS